MGSAYADIPRYRAFKVTYYGPTNTKGSRVKIHDLWYEDYIMLSRDGTSSSFEQACQFLKKFLPIRGYACSGDGNYDFILVDNYTCRLKEMRNEYNKTNR